MDEGQLFVQLKLWRRWTVEFLQTIPEEVADILPPGHNNSIRWNAGHILVGWDHTMFPAVHEERKLPLSYHLMFGSGSKPEDWAGKPPSMEGLIGELKEQVIKIEESCKGHLEDSLNEDFLGMDRLGDMLVFHMNHESLHMGIIKSMKQSLEK